MVSTRVASQRVSPLLPSSCPLQAPTNAPSHLSQQIDCDPIPGALATLPLQPESRLGAPAPTRQMAPTPTATPCPFVVPRRGAGRGAPAKRGAAVGVGPRWCSTGAGACGGDAPPATRSRRPGQPRRELRPPRSQQCPAHPRPSRSAPRSLRATPMAPAHAVPPPPRACSPRADLRRGPSGPPWALL